ncbi:MAG: DUF2975 domain-containing protein [Oscillospiraceae bacterium]|nr:DUF2975 domain-containing protein [Oscillospiraceae bacterium]
MAHNKMMSTAKKLDTFTRIVGEVFRAFSIVCAVFVVLVLIVGSDMFVPGTLSLDLDFIKIHLAEDYQTISNMMKIYTIVSLVSVGVLCLMVHRISTLVRQILAPMKDGRPFENHIPANLKKIAWLVLIGGAIAEVLGIVARILITHAYPMGQIFSSPAVAKLEYVYNMDFTFVLIAGILLFLSYIFSYGQALQQEADETL